MESPAEDKTPSNEVKLHCKTSALRQNRSAPTSFSKAGLTPCRRVGLKRKSTPGIIFQSPLKDNNSKLIDQTATSLTPSLGKNNLFSRAPNQSSHSENSFKTPTSEKEKVKETPDSLKNKSEPSSPLTVKTNKKLGTNKIATPILSRHGRVGQCSLSKKLKLSSDSPSDHNKHNLENSLSYSELTETLNKDHNTFLKLYYEFTSDAQEDSTKTSQKYEVIARMKRMFDQIKELKESLINAKQHDISKLESLAKKWRDGCQTALYLLLEKLQEQGHKCDMSQLLLESGIPSKLVNFDEDIQDFVV